MSLLQYILSKKHHAFRHTFDWDLAADYSAANLSPIERMTRRFEKLCAVEAPVLLPDEHICFLRTVANIPEVFTKDEWEEIKQKHFVHELGYLSNLSPDYEKAISQGLLSLREGVDEYGKRAIDAILDLTDRYRAEAKKQGRDDVAAVLEHIPAYGARNFREALQSFRILHFALWLEGEYHNTVGRFDQYMLPYFEHDMATGVYTDDSALALLEDFFLSFNKDSDLYPGVQQGDNGQSMMLGGVRPDGADGFNALSELCLKASKSLKLIDPKINLRVGKNTPLRVYELGSELTKEGLGFPQYSNDDVVIPGLIKLGYEPQDAADYTVAACWEFIIPKVGADVANIGALSYAKVVDKAFHEYLASCANFDEFMAHVKAGIKTEADKICDSIQNLWFVPAPFVGLLTNPNIANGAKYNNFGLHGTGIATGADSLAAIKKYVYDQKSIAPAEYIKAVDADFEGFNELLSRLRYHTPKIGQNDDYADLLGVELLDTFAAALDGKTNCRGGKFRAGTGSAMYYLWHANEIGASPDGRKKGEAFGTNFSVSLFAKTPGPMSVISSFNKFRFVNAINGGPLTLEFAGKIFESEESVAKLAGLVKAFIDGGGHQLQLNAVNAEKMREAQRHPEDHRQLVVRIWGWSAYFVELDKEYQDHVLARKEYGV